MKLKPITLELTTFPKAFHKYLNAAKLYDSSCSPFAQVTYVEKDKGYFIKRSKKGSLEREVEMTTYFNSKGLSAKVLDYVQDDLHDWVVTTKIPGFDCIEAIYLNNPTKLIDILAQRLFLLHQEDYTDCPIQNHTQRLLESAENGYKKGRAEVSFLKIENLYEISSVKEAHLIVDKFGNSLQTNTLLHGDYCLPNIILNDWKFSGFIDLDTGGVGDRHVDIFWGIWTLQYNLGTAKYTNRFIDAYGSRYIDKDVLKIVAAAEVFG